MVSALNSGSRGPGSSPGWGHCVMFLGKTLYSHSASLHPGVQMGTSIAPCDGLAILSRGEYLAILLAEKRKKVRRRPHGPLYHTYIHTHTHTHTHTHILLYLGL